MATVKKAPKPNPRKVRTYKVVDSVYKKAMSKAKKEKCTLSQHVENFVTKYAGITTTKVDIASHPDAKMVSLKQIFEPFDSAD